MQPCRPRSEGRPPWLRHLSLERPWALGSLTTSTRPKRGKLLEEPVKRTYQPHRKRRIRTHGFRARMKTANGRKVINSRRRKGRARLGVTVYKK